MNNQTDLVYNKVAYVVTSYFWTTVITRNKMPKMPSTTALGRTLVSGRSAWPNQLVDLLLVLQYQYITPDTVLELKTNLFVSKTITKK